MLDVGWNDQEIASHHRKLLPIDGIEKLASLHQANLFFSVPVQHCGGAFPEPPTDQTHRLTVNHAASGLRVDPLLSYLAPTVNSRSLRPLLAIDLRCHVDESWLLLMELAARARIARPEKPAANVVKFPFGQLVLVFVLLYLWIFQ